MEKLLLSESFLDLLTSHQKRLAGYLRTLVPNRTDADEILQEANLYICRHADDFQLGTDFAAWALKITHYSVLTWRERQSRDRLTFDDELLERLAHSEQQFAQQADRRREALGACLQKLPNQDRELITQLYDGTCRSPRDVAQRLNRSAKGIYESLNRIRLRLLECIQRTLAAEDRS